MKKSNLTLAFVAGLASFPGNVKAVNLLQNSDFSSYSISYNGPRRPKYKVVTLANWTVEGQFNDVQVGNGYLSGNSLYMGAGPTDTVDKISQTISTTIGQQYKFSFYITGADNNTSNEVFADINGVRVIDILNNNSYPQWTLLSAIFTASGTTTSVGMGTWTANDHHLVSNFSVTAVPEPSTYGLIGIAALGVAFAARRRKLKKTA